MRVAGHNYFSILCAESNSKGVTNLPTISPSLNSRLDVSSLLSYSVYDDHSVWVLRDGRAFGIGNGTNGKICGKFPKSLLSKQTEIFIKDKKGSPYIFLSAVCGTWYTLYLLQSQDGGKDQLKLAYSCYSKDVETPVFIKTGKHNPVALYGGSTTAAAIDQDGYVILITESILKSPDHKPEIVSLPDDSKAVSVGCLEKSYFILSENGLLYKCVPTEDGYELKLVEELSEMKIVEISATAAHCLAVTSDGHVYGHGINESGRIGVSSPFSKVYTFTEIAGLKGHKVTHAFAGCYHSLFLTRDGLVLACGSNYNGELFLSEGPSDEPILSPQKTTVQADASFCIAGIFLSAIFVGVDPPPNSPNLRFDEEYPEFANTTLSINLPSELSSMNTSEVDRMVLKPLNMVENLKFLEDELISSSVSGFESRGPQDIEISKILNQNVISLNRPSSKTMSSASKFEGREPTSPIVPNKQADESNNDKSPLSALVNNMGDKLIGNSENNSENKSVKKSDNGSNRSEKQSDAKPSSRAESKQKSDANLSSASKRSSTQKVEDRHLSNPSNKEEKGSLLDIGQKMRDGLDMQNSKNSPTASKKSLPSAGNAEALQDENALKRSISSEKNKSDKNLSNASKKTSENKSQKQSEAGKQSSSKPEEKHLSSASKKTASNAPENKSQKNSEGKVSSAKPEERNLSSESKPDQRSQKQSSNPQRSISSEKNRSETQKQDEAPMTNMLNNMGNKLMKNSETGSKNSPASEKTKSASAKEDSKHVSSASKKTASNAPENKSQKNSEGKVSSAKPEERNLSSESKPDQRSQKQSSNQQRSISSEKNRSETQKQDEAPMTNMLNNMGNKLMKNSESGSKKTPASEKTKSASGKEDAKHVSSASKKTASNANKDLSSASKHSTTPKVEDRHLSAEEPKQASSKEAKHSGTQKLEDKHASSTKKNQSSEVDEGSFCFESNHDRQSKLSESELEHLRKQNSELKELLASKDKEIVRLTRLNETFIGNNKNLQTNLEECWDNQKHKIDKLDQLNSKRTKEVKS